MSDAISIAEAKELIEFCKAHGVRKVKLRYFEAELGAPETKTTMPLDPQSLAKVFSDPMPPDSAMLFAATEDLPISPENVEPNPKQRESA